AAVFTTLQHHCGVGQYRVSGGAGGPLHSAEPITPFSEKTWHRLACWWPRKLTVNVSELFICGHVLELRSTKNVTSAGRCDTDANDPTASPTGVPPPVVVTIAPGVGT